MPQVETLPQSIADVKTIVLKPRLDLGDLRLIGEKIKPSLFSRLGFRSKPENVRLLVSETYFEPYLIIAGKYVLDYCKKHIFEVNVKETTTKIFVAGQEFRSEQSDPKVTNKVVKMVGEEYAHHERESYYVLDRVKREIPPEKLPISPFEAMKETIEPDSTFKSIHISDETQIEFLKTKIAQRPADVAEIIREVFDITDRIIAYYPMYQLIFENIMTREDATVTINGITGEITLNGTKKLAVKTIFAFDQNKETQPIREAAYGEKQIETSLKANPPEKKDKAKKTLREEKSQPTQTDLEETAPYEESRMGIILNMDSTKTIDKTKSTPKEEDSSQTTQNEAEETPVCEATKTETSLNINPPEATNHTWKTPKKEKTSCYDTDETTDHEEARIKTNPSINTPKTMDKKKSPLEKEKTIQQPQPDAEETMILGFPAKIYGKVLATDDNKEVVAGDVDIPSGTEINKTLIVRGALKIGNNCRAHGKLKALKDVTVGADTIIEGDVISGGNVFVGPRSLISGSVKAAGVFEIEENAVVEGIYAQTPPSQ